MQLCVWAKDRNSKRLPFHCCATLASTKERSRHKFLVSRREVEDVLLRQDLLSIPCLLDSVLYSKAVQIFLLSHFVYFVSTRCIHFADVSRCIHLLLTRIYNPGQKSSGVKYSWAAELSQSSQTSPSRHRSEQRPLEGNKARGMKFMHNSKLALCNGKWLHSRDLFEFYSSSIPHFSWFIWFMACFPNFQVSSCLASCKL